jgi:hypothetical protein
MKILNISLSDAYMMWKDAYKKDDYVLSIMNYIVKKEKPRILLNRNPTINLYSMLMLRIRRVKDDWKRTTLSVPLFILAGLNADQRITARSGRVVTHSREVRERLTNGVNHSLRMVS